LSRLSLRHLVACALLLGVLAVAAVPVLGAAVIEYFNVVSSSSAILLEWSTTSEYNVAGFEVQCKVATEPNSAYHRIGYFNAKGGPTEGAQYDMLVTDLSPGVSYCFRLKEITTDDTPGEVRERCGYGLSITPTPKLAVPLTSTVGLTPTVVLFPGATPTFDPFATMVPTPTFDPFATISPTPTFDPFATLTPTPTFDPFATFTPTPTFVANAGVAPTLDPFATYTPTIDPLEPIPTATPPGLQPQSPLPTPLGAVATPDALAASLPTIDPLSLPVQPTLDPLAAPPTATLDPIVVATQTAAAVLAAGQPLTPTASATILPTPTLTATVAITGQGATAPPAAAAGGSQVNDDTAVVAPTPTSLYVVVTAVPTPVSQGVASVVTPWPTAAPPPGLQLTSYLQPTTQNLTVMLLCFIFISAAGLGMLGLITSVIYMRSRNQRELDEMRLRYRRRL
jgi:hypothetical protein